MLIYAAQNGELGICFHLYYVLCIVLCVCVCIHVHMCVYMSSHVCVHTMMLNWRSYDTLLRSPLSFCMWVPVINKVISKLIYLISHFMAPGNKHFHKTFGHLHIFL